MNAKEGDKSNLNKNNVGIKLITANSGEQNEDQKITTS